jgi:hypothetical protein
VAEVKVAGNRELVMLVDVLAREKNVPRSRSISTRANGTASGVFL